MKKYLSFIIMTAVVAVACATSYPVAAGVGGSACATKADCNSGNATGPIDCCNGKCCGTSLTTCCNGQCKSAGSYACGGATCCSSSQSCCDEILCFDGNQSYCCEDGNTGHICPNSPYRSCCGTNGCCNPTTQDCCNGQCVPKPSTLCTNNTCCSGTTPDCCDGGISCYNGQNGKCCNQGNGHVCTNGTTCCGANNCCTGLTPNCCNNNQCYSSSQECCPDGTVKPLGQCGAVVTPTPAGL